MWRCFGILLAVLAHVEKILVFFVAQESLCIVGLYSTIQNFYQKQVAGSLIELYLFHGQVCNVPISEIDQFAFKES